MEMCEGRPSGPSVASTSGSIHAMVPKRTRIPATTMTSEATAAVMEVRVPAVDRPLPPAAVSVWVMNGDRAMGHLLAGTVGCGHPHAVPRSLRRLS